MTTHTAPTTAPTMTIHAHVETHSTDCDGALSGSHVMSPSREERHSQFGEIEFRDRVLVSIMSAYTAVAGRLDVTGDHETGTTTRLEWNERTEEGGRSAVATFCEDDCDLDEHSRRDHAAEAAGY